MFKRIAARSALVLSLVVPSVAVLASPAMAFTKATGCSSSTVGTGQWIEFRTDAGAVAGRITWFWAWAGQDSRYQLVVANNSSVGLSARVDFGSQVIEYSANKKIGAAVTKYRAVWNGYASSWYPANYCDTSIRP